MFGDKIESRRRSRFPTKLSSLKALLALVIAFEAFVINTTFSNPQIFYQYTPVEAFVPTNRQTRDSCGAFPQLGSVTPSSYSTLIPNMASRHNDEGGNGSAPPNQGQSQRSHQQQHSQRDKDPRRREATTNAAPMYITIGPQCCGKSSFLRTYGDGTIKDISLDDQRDVYVPIPTEIFLHAYDDNNNGDKNKRDGKQDPLIQQVYQGKTIAERIRENVELILILQRWNGDSTASDFKHRVKNYYEERGLDGNVATALVEAVEVFLSNRPDLPKETDVFVLESLFKPHPQSKQSAIQRALEELRETPKHIPVAWGNTNSKPKDYERALEICHQTRRPLRFILCHPEHGNRNADDTNNESELMALPWLPLEELLKRNLHRLQISGKFVPANAIADCRKRVEALIPSTLSKRESVRAHDSKWIEEHLVVIASPSVGGRGPSRHNNGRPSPSFRYVLTKHRLVQKEYPRNDANYRPNNHGRNSRGGRSNEGRGRGNGNQGRFNDGGGRGRGKPGRYNDRTKNRNRYGGSGEGNNSDRRYRQNQQARPPPNQEDAPPRARRKYNDK